MKKFAMLALAMSLFLVACGEKTAEKAAETVETAKEEVKEAATEVKEAAENMVADATSFTVKSEDGKEYMLVVAGDVATLTDAEGKAMELKRAESASGEKYADEAGNEIHFKAEEGILTLGEMKDVPVTVTQVEAK